MQAAIDQAGARGLERALVDEHFPHRFLMAFADGETQIHQVRLPGRLRAPLEGGIGEPVVEVLRQDGIAVHRHVEFAERLVFGAVEHGEDGRLLQTPDSLDLQVVDEVLRPSSMVR